MIDLEEKANATPGKENSGFTSLFKFLRLARIPRIMKILDAKNFNMMVDCLLSNMSSAKKVTMQSMLKNVYKVVRLVLLTVMVTYVGGCIIHFTSDLQSKSIFGYEDRTFVKFYFKPEDEHTSIYKLIRCVYFSITTLSTVGYGDLCPQSEFEMCLVIIFMLAGVAYFSFIMGSFIEIVQTINQTGVET